MRVIIDISPYFKITFQNVALWSIKATVLANKGKKPFLDC